MDIVAHYQDTSYRRVLDLRPAGLAEVPVLGRYSYTEARPDVPVHRHFGCLEVHYCASGRQVFEVGSERYTLRGGELSVTFPDEPHSTGGEPSEPGTTYWFVLRMPRPRQRVLGLQPRRVPRWWPVSGPFPVGTSPLRCGRNGCSTNYSTSTTARTRCCAAQMRQTMVSLLLEVVDGAMRDPERPISSRLASIVEHIQAAPEEEYSLNGLARDAHLSLPRFKSRFKAETGMSPWQFILQCKIEAAQSRLRGGNEPITKIALDLGFSSPPYFATVFKRITGFTPRTYRAELPPRGATTRRDDGQG